MAYGKKEEENRQISEIFSELDRKMKKSSTAGKEASKLKKLLKEKDKENNKLKSDLNTMKAVTEE